MHAQYCPSRVPAQHEDSQKRPSWTTACQILQLPCLKGLVVYRAAITSDHKTEYYSGIAGNNFKEQVNKQKYDIRTLTNHIWVLKGIRLWPKLELQSTIIQRRAADYATKKSGTLRSSPKVPQSMKEQNLKTRWYISFWLLIFDVI